MDKMTRDEAIKNVLAYVYLEGLNMPKDVIKALDVLMDSAKAWDKVIEKIEQNEQNTFDGRINKKVVLGIINKHLGKLQQEEQ